MKSKTHNTVIVDEDETIQPPPTIIFCTRPKTVAYFMHSLNLLHIRATALHSREVEFIGPVPKRGDSRPSLNLCRCERIGYRRRRVGSELGYAHGTGGVHASCQANGEKGTTRLDSSLSTMKRGYRRSRRESVFTEFSKKVASRLMSWYRHPAGGNVPFGVESARTLE